MSPRGRNKRSLKGDKYEKDEKPERFQPAGSSARTAETAGDPGRGDGATAGGKTVRRSGPVGRRRQV